MVSLGNRKRICNVDQTDINDSKIREYDINEGLLGIESNYHAKPI